MPLLCVGVIRRYMWFDTKVGVSYMEDMVGIFCVHIPMGLQQHILFEEDACIACARLLLILLKREFTA